MELIKKVLPQAMQSLHKQLQRASQERELRRNGSCDISIFHPDQEATSRQILVAVNKLSVAFPEMKKEFFNILSEQIAKSGFSAQRLDYALNYILNNFRYKQLTIADIMSIDIKCKIYTYSQVISQASISRNGTEDYVPIWIGDNQRPQWVLKEDKERYNLPDKI